MKIRQILQLLLDRSDILFYGKQAVIGNHPFRWCTAPTPEGYPRQSQTHPSIQYFPTAWNGYTHWLATTPYPNKDIRFENPCIYRANAHQGIAPDRFEPAGKNPVLPHPGGAAFNSDPELFDYEGKLYCIVRENENGRYLREIKLMSTADGVNWSAPQTIITSNDEARQLLSPSYIETDGKHRIYFLNGNAGIGKHGSCTGIEIWESNSIEKPDFKLVTKGDFINSAETGIEPWHFDLFRYKGLLYMVLCARVKRKFTLRSPMETFLAVSDDEANFRIFPRPLIRHLKSYRPTAYVDESGMFHLYFSLTGMYLKDGSDSNIAVVSMRFEELLKQFSLKKHIK